MANGLVAGNDCMAEPHLVAVICALVGEREAPCGFGEDVLAGRVNQRDHSTLDIQAEDDELGKGGQALVDGAFGAVALVYELPGLSIGVFSEVLGSVDLDMSQSRHGFGGDEGVLSVPMAGSICTRSVL